MTLTLLSDDYDYGKYNEIDYDENDTYTQHQLPNIEIQAEEVTEVMDDIKVARFVLKNPKQYHENSFECSAANGSYTSPNVVTIKEVSDDDYFISEWTEWSKCSNVKNKTMTFRTRRAANGNEAMQSRYCRCSDLKELPSPRFVHCKIEINITKFALILFLGSCCLEKLGLVNQRLEIK